MISILIYVIRRGEDTVKCELKCFGKSEVITQSFNEKTLNIVPEFKVPHSALGNVTAKTKWKCLAKFYTPFLPAAQRLSLTLVWLGVVGKKTFVYFATWK